MSINQIAVGRMIRIVDVIHVPVVLFHDVRFHRMVVVPTKIPSAGGGSMLVSM